MSLSCVPLYSTEKRCPYERLAMRINNRHYRTIWLKKDDPEIIEIIDQRHLPHHFVIEELKSVDDTARAIRDMHVRGAGLIGAAAGYGMYLGALHAPRDSTGAFMDSLRQDAETLKATRPTAVNLPWAVERIFDALKEKGLSIDQKIETAMAAARTLADEDAEFCRLIGEHGVGIIEQ